MIKNSLSRANPEFSESRSSDIRRAGFLLVMPDCSTWGLRAHSSCIDWTRVREARCTWRQTEATFVEPIVPGECSLSVSLNPVGWVGRAGGYALSRWLFSEPTAPTKPTGFWGREKGAVPARGVGPWAVHDSTHSCATGCALAAQRRSRMGGGMIPLQACACSQGVCPSCRISSLRRGSSYSLSR